MFLFHLRGGIFSAANYCLRKNIIPSNVDFATRKKLKVIQKRYLAKEKFRESNLFFNHQFTVKLLLFSRKNRRWANHDYFFWNEIFSCCLFLYRRDDVAPRGSSFFFSSARAHLHTPPTRRQRRKPIFRFPFIIYSHKKLSSAVQFVGSFFHTHTLRWSSRKKENWWWHPIHSNTVEETKSIGYLINVASQKDLLQFKCKLQTDLSQDQHVHDNNSIFISILDCKKEYLVMTYVLRIGEWRSYLNLEPVIGQVNLNEIFSKKIMTSTNT